MSRIDQALELVGKCEPAVGEHGGYNLGKREIVYSQTLGVATHKKQPHRIPPGGREGRLQGALLSNLQK